MPLLGVFVNSGVACLASGLTCFAHGIAGFAAPDAAHYQVRTFGAAAPSIPVGLESLTSAAVIWRNSNGAGLGGDQLVILFHGIIR